MTIFQAANKELRGALEDVAHLAEKLCHWIKNDMARKNGKKKHLTALPCANHKLS